MHLLKNEAENQAKHPSEQIRQKTRICPKKEE